MATAKRTAKSGAGNVSSKENDTAGVIEGLLADTESAVEEFMADYASTPADLDYRNFTADAAAARLVIVAIAISLVALVASEWLARRAGTRLHGG